MNKSIDSIVDMRISIDSYNTKALFLLVVEGPVIFVVVEPLVGTEVVVLVRPVVPSKMIK